MNQHQSKTEMNVLLVLGIVMTTKWKMMHVHKLEKHKRKYNYLN